MHDYVLRPRVVVLWGWLAFISYSHAQTPPPPSLHQAVEAAWSLSPQARALDSRRAEWDARARAASSLISGPPSLSLSQRTDRVGSNGGLSETEVEVSAPVWTPRVRRTTADLVEADRAAFEQQQALAKAKLTAEVTELAAQATLAQIERDLARNKQREAQILAADVERRVKVGDVARVDLLQAQSVQWQATAAQTRADSALTRALAQWRALTGLTQIVTLDEVLGTAQEPSHTVLTLAKAQLRAAQAKLAWTEADRRDPMEVGLGMTQERPTFGAPRENSLKLSLRVPLGSDNRNAPKLAAAQAEVDAAQAEILAAARMVEAEREATLAEWEAARQAEALAADRERASREVHALIAKAYRLGESDLPTRLRAEGERFDAELNHARAQLETRRAIARLNQSNGILP